MFSKPRQLETESELYDVAVRALMRRAHSVHEMKKKLERRSDNELLVQLVMARLKENGMIDDARYAKQFARQRTESRKQGKFRIARDLRGRGIPDRHIEAALDETAKTTDEGAMVRQRIEGRAPELALVNQFGQPLPLPWGELGAPSPAMAVDQAVYPMQQEVLAPLIEARRTETPALTQHRHGHVVHQQVDQHRGASH